MPRRSVLFSPGDQPDLMRKAPGSDADVVVFDLEDAVGPANKGSARNSVRNVITDPTFDPDCEVCVRVSNANEDIATLTESEAERETELRLDSVMVPKAEGTSDVEDIAAVLSTHGIDARVIALCETAQGILNAQEIAAARPTTAIAFGAEDLAADIGARRTSEGTEVLYAREHVVLAASAAGVDVIDTVHTDIEDTDRLAEETEFARDLGYDGKMAIHPTQIPIIHDAFMPSAEQIEWAKRVLDARDKAEKRDQGVFRVGGEMIDAPLIAQAESILERSGVTESYRGSIDKY